MMFKKFIAFAVVATMVVGSTVTAFADEGVTGSGAIEYDDSVAISYDKIQVPTVTASTFEFTMDPTNVISTAGYGSTAAFESGKNIFFHAQDDAAYIEAAQNGVWYKEKYDTYAADATSSKYRGIVTAANFNTDETEVTGVTTVAPGFYLWVPDAAYANGAGLSGKYIEINKDNVLKYFDATVYTDSDTKKVQLAFRADFKAGEDVCNGIVYQLGYEAAGSGGESAKAKFIDSKENPLSDIVTVSDAGAITKITGLYKDVDGTKTAAATTDFVYTAATSMYKDTTDTVYVKNLSTKIKTVTAKVTLKDADGLTIGGAKTFSGDDLKKAAIYVGAWDDGAETPAFKALTKGSDGVISTTVTMDLAAATDNGVTTYQTTEFNKLGGHKYNRYSGPSATYTSNVFKIEASINPTSSGADAVKAWEDYFKAAEKAPSINVVYTVKNKDGSASASAATATLEMRGSNNYFMLAPNGASTFEGLTDISAVTAATAKLNNGDAVNVLSYAKVSNGQVGFKYIDLKTPLGFESATTGDTFVFTVTVNGTVYEATYVRP